MGFGNATGFYRTGMSKQVYRSGNIRQRVFPETENPGFPCTAGNASFPAVIRTNGISPGKRAHSPYTPPETTPHLSGGKAAGMQMRTKKNRSHEKL